MRELVYLSERKLGQFVERPKRLLGRAKIEAELSVPGVGHVKFNSASGDDRAKVIRKLDEVIKSLKNSAREPRTFTAEGLKPGEWVSFRAPLFYDSNLIDTKNGNAAVVFVNSRPEVASPKTNAVRLFMHGDAENLTTSQSAHYSMRSASYVRDFIGMLNELLGDQDGDDLPGRAGEQLSLSAVVGYQIQTAIMRLDLGFGSLNIAAWMAGHARVTSVFDYEDSSRVVLASPLYVEHVERPEGR